MAGYADHLGGSIMSHYRAYIIGHDGHFVDVHKLDYPDDASATAAAKEYVDGRAVELWHRDRKVVRFETTSDENK
jgi:hypothetical protein